MHSAISWAVSTSIFSISAALEAFYEDFLLILPFVSVLLSAPLGPNAFARLTIFLQQPPEFLASSSFLFLSIAVLWAMSVTFKISFLVLICKDLLDMIH